jgi:hypothetical protein
MQIYSSKYLVTQRKRDRAQVKKTQKGCNSQYCRDDNVPTKPERQTETLHEDGWLIAGSGQFVFGSAIIGSALQ